MTAVLCDMNVLDCMRKNGDVTISSAASTATRGEWRRPREHEVSAMQDAPTRAGMSHITPNTSPIASTSGWPKG